MYGFTVLVVVLVAALAGTLAFYSRRKWTLPRFRGDGGVWLLLTAVSIGIGGVWLAGRLAGLSNVFKSTGQALSFHFGYDNTLQTAGAFVYLAGLIVLGIVVGFVNWGTSRAEL